MASEQFHLIVSIDYEVFGNGSGCIRPCIVEPMIRLTSILERHGGKASVFVEALEFSAMEAAGNEDVQVVRRQLAALVQNGHEINLHLHPQWLNAELRRDGTWCLNNTCWRMGDLDALTVQESVQRGLDWIRSALADIAPGYHCTAFRAGGWAIQPSPLVIGELQQQGFSIESSVAPRAHNRRHRAWFDFRNAPDLPYWAVTKDVMSVGNGRLFEVPIVVGKVSPIRHLRALAARKRKGEFAAGCHGSYESRAHWASRLLAIADRLRGARWAMLDVCALPASLMIDVANDWISRNATRPDQLPLVAIGHTKNFSPSAEYELDVFLEWAARQSRLKISTYADWLDAAGSQSTESG